MKVMCKPFILALFILGLVCQGKPIAAQSDTGSNFRLNDTGSRMRPFVFYFQSAPFADSLRTDSLRSIIRAKHQPSFNRISAPPIDDPWSPFLNIVYKKQQVAKNWFFYAFLLILLLFIINKNYYSTVFNMRLKAVFSRSAYKDLLENLHAQTYASFILTVVTTQAVLALFVVATLTAYGYTLLANNFLFFLIIFIFLLTWWWVLYLVQMAHCALLDMGEMHRNAMVTRTNHELLLSLILLPMALILYLNLYVFDGKALGETMFIMLLGIFCLRFLTSLWSQIQHKHLNLFGLLYFCGLEILPHLLVFTFLRQALQ
jgi:hypothetical protein